jgi:hypothetical protein
VLGLKKERRLCAHCHKPKGGDVVYILVDILKVIGGLIEAGLILAALRWMAQHGKAKMMQEYFQMEREKIEAKKPRIVYTYTPDTNGREDWADE